MVPPKFALFLAIVIVIKWPVQAQNDDASDDSDDYIDSLPDVRCRLPAERGLCKALIVRWRYDPGTQRCRKFVFGGCAKRNVNNFPTRKACMDTCSDVW